VSCEQLRNFAQSPKRKKASEGKESGDAPEKKKRDASPVPPRTKDYSDSGSFWTYRASEGAVMPIFSQI
jgi:hypothetical protein